MLLAWWTLGIWNAKFHEFSYLFKIETVERHPKIQNLKRKTQDTYAKKIMNNSKFKMKTSISL